MIHFIMRASFLDLVRSVTRTSTPLGEHSALKRTSLYDRRLSTSIHNPANQQAASTPLPEQDQAEIEDLTNPQTSTPNSPTPNPTPEPVPQPLRLIIPDFPPPDPPPRRGTRTQKALERYGYAAMAQRVVSALEPYNVPLMAAMVKVGDPQSFQEATSSTD